MASNKSFVKKLANLASVVAFVGGVLGSTVLGHSGLELVSAGLALHVGGDLLDEILS